MWALSPIPSPPDDVMVQSLYSNIYHALNVQKEYPIEDIQAEIASWLMWRLWKNRNELVFNGKEYEAECILRKAREDAEEWKGRKVAEETAVKRLEVQQPTITNQANPWRPPPSNWVKCNSDSAWHNERDTSGLGWICRNETGEVLWAGARAVTKTGSAILAEAEALKWGAETLANFGYKNIIFETDSLQLAKMINGTEEVWPILHPTIELIRHHLLQIGSFEVRFYPRGGNKAADIIAKESITFVSSIPMLYSVVPMWLKYQVWSDKSVY